MNSTAALRIFSKSTIDVCRRSCLLSPSYPLRRFVAAYKPPSTWPHARTSIVDGIHHAGSIVPSRRHLSTATQWKENESQSENKSKISSFPPWSPESSLAEAAASGKETIEDVEFKLKENFHEKCIDWQPLQKPFEKYRIFNRSMLSKSPSPKLETSMIQPSFTRSYVPARCFHLSATTSRSQSDPDLGFGWAYNRLGVSPTATQQEVKDAFYKLSYIHPDSPYAKKKFEELKEAYSAVGNPDSDEIFVGTKSQAKEKNIDRPSHWMDGLELLSFFAFLLIPILAFWLILMVKRVKEWEDAFYKLSAERETERKREIDTAEGPSSTRDEDRMSDEAIPNIDPEISNESYLRDLRDILKDMIETERKREIDTADSDIKQISEGPSLTRDEDRMSDEAIPNIDPEISNESYLRDSMLLLCFVSVAILLHR